MDAIRPRNSSASSTHGHMDHATISYFLRILNPLVIIHDRDNVGLTPLHHACIEGREDIAALLLQSGPGRDRTDTLKGDIRLSYVNLNARDDFGESSLHKACTRGWEQVVRLLLHAGADANVSDKVKGSGKESGDPWRRGL
jgi:ankyrin repeat protein